MLGENMDMCKKGLVKLLPIALLLVSCTVEESFDSEGRVPVVLKATISDAEWSRAGTTVNNVFTSGDVFYAYFPTDVMIGDDVEDCGTTYTYNGTKWSPATQPYFKKDVTSCTVHAYYPYLYGQQVTETATSFSVEQAQNADANYKQSDLMYATTTVSKNGSTSSGTLSFVHRMAKIVVNATLGEGISSISGVYIIGGCRTIDITDGTVCTLGTSLSDPVSASSPITAFHDFQSSGTLRCAALLPPQTISGDLLQIETNAGKVTYSVESKSFETSRTYTINLTISASSIGTTVGITEWSEDPTPITTGVTIEKGTIEVVDLGLPSGTKWANMNLGAAVETGRGLYFPWAGKKGYSGAISSGTTAADGHVFNWENALYKGSVPYEYVKYNSTDNYSCLTMSDDVANLFLGDLWCIPQGYHFEELVHETFNEWVEDYKGTGVSGYKFTNKSNSSKYIFLPAAGHRVGSSIFDQGEVGYYTTSTVNAGTPKLFKFPGFNYNNPTMASDYRDHGQSIRPVYAPPFTLLSNALPSDVGKVVCSNGHIHSTVSAATATGCTACGVIAYVNANGSASSSCPDVSGSYRGLALALNDVQTQYVNPQEYNGVYMSNVINWCDLPQISAYSGQTAICLTPSTTWYDAKTRYDGLFSTAEACGLGHTHPAASLCYNYNGQRPSGASTWFLPSMGQWNLMVRKLSAKVGKTEVDMVTNYPNYSDPVTSGNLDQLASVLNIIITAAGATGLQSWGYWSSTDCREDDAWAVELSGGFDSAEPGATALTWYKYYWPSMNMACVRPVFAF